MIQPIEKKNVADEVFEKMLNMIIEGDWKKGEMIPSENELREAFSVSRSTVRQAVQRLSALGIVRSRQGKGTYVEQVGTSFYLNLLIPSLMLSGGDSISILEFTKSIQVECVRIVSQCASDEEIARLSDYLEQMRFAGDYESYFHFVYGLPQLFGPAYGESAVYQSDRNCGKSASCLSAGYRCLSRQQKEHAAA